MIFLLLCPTIFCALIMAAHFLRDLSYQWAVGATFPAAWDFFMVIMCLGLPLLLLIRRRVVLRMMQLLLLLAAVELLLIGYDIVRERMAEMNPDVVAPGIIMAATAAFSVLAALLYQAKRLKTRYQG